MSEAQIVQNRIEKSAQNGVLRYPTSNTRAMSIVKMRLAALGNEGMIHGRVVLIRKGGGITFMILRDDTADIQLIFTKKDYADYANLNKIDIGDIIEVLGIRMQSKTDEVSVMVKELLLLTKAIRPLPEKWAGLTDTDTRYRQRYLDLIANERSRKVFKARSVIVSTIRNLLEDEGFMEVETSTLNGLNSGANALPFITKHNALGKDLFLRIAPELQLKKLIVGGFERVYEIGRCYRNEGLSTRHNPEFTMLEFYWAYNDFRKLIGFTQDFIRSIDQTLMGTMPSFYKEVYGHRTFSFSEVFVIISMHQAIAKAAKKMFIEIAPDFSKHTAKSEATNIPRFNQMKWADLYFQLQEVKTAGERQMIWFEHIVEPFLQEDYRTQSSLWSMPVIITEYPIEVCPLARAKDSDKTVADRFELYINGMEIANAFQELNDPAEQLKRFNDQLKTNNKDPMDLDEDYIKALETGMPPCVGFGCGIDRLAMVLTSTQSIRDVVLFPTLR